MNLESLQKELSKIQQQERLKAAGTATKQQLERKKIQLIIYVGNLPLSWTHNNISKYFSQFGEIIEVRPIRKRKAFSGIAFVKFSSMMDAEMAIEKLKNTTIMGSNKNIIIKWLDTQEKRLGIGEKDGHKLYVCSLPRHTTQSIICQVFSIFGKIENVKINENQYWALVDYERKESALLAIKYLNKQTYLNGSELPIQVRFKEKVYHSFNDQNNPAEDIDPFVYNTANLYHQVKDPSLGKYFYSYQTRTSQYELPPPGARVYYTAKGKNGFYIQTESKNIPNREKKFDPLGANLFLFHLPNHIRGSQLYNLFKRFGKILSAKVMTQRKRQLKGIGIGFISFDNPKSAEQAIKEMNGFELYGKRLKVQLKKNQKDISTESMSLKQYDLNVCL